MRIPTSAGAVSGFGAALSLTHLQIRRNPKIRIPGFGFICPLIGLVFRTKTCVNFLVFSIVFRLRISRSYLTRRPSPMRDSAAPAWWTHTHFKWQRRTGSHHALSCAG